MLQSLKIAKNFGCRRGTRESNGECDEPRKKVLMLRKCVGIKRYPAIRGGIAPVLGEGLRMLATSGH